VATAEELPFVLSFLHHSIASLDAVMTSRMMKRLSILNAEARRAADEELLAQLDQRVQ
jgi:hypothetical protein